MMRRGNPYSRRPRPGVTLIGVVIGLIVLTLLVSAVTVARGRFMRQWSESQRKLQAADAVDRMLAGWIGNGGPDDAIPVPAQGPLCVGDGCTWRTNWVNDPAAARLGAGI